MDVESHKIRSNESEIEGYPNFLNTTARMEYKPQTHKIEPRLIIHGGAGNIKVENFPPEKYATYREALLTIVHASFHTSDMKERLLTSCRSPRRLCT